MTKKVDAIIQARLGSSRFPRKVLTEINGKKLIEHVIISLKASPAIDRIIIATTDQPHDQELVEFCERSQLLYFRGDCDDVLMRFIGAAETFNCDKIVRVCSDNPFIDLQSLNKLLEVFLSDPKLDYCTHVTADGVPIILNSLGLFVEAVSVKALKKIVEMTQEKKYLEHVTMFIYRHPEFFNIATIPLPTSVNPNYRFTVDYKEDFIHCEKIMKSLSHYSMDSIFDLIKRDGILSEQILNFSKNHLKHYT